MIIEFDDSFFDYEDDTLSIFLEKNINYFKKFKKIYIADFEGKFICYFKKFKGINNELTVFAKSDSDWLDYEALCDVLNSQIIKINFFTFDNLAFIDVSYKVDSLCD